MRRGQFEESECMTDLEIATCIDYLDMVTRGHEKLLLDKESKLKQLQEEIEGLKLSIAFGNARRNAYSRALETRRKGGGI
jgi:hypothetical protein